LLLVVVGVEAELTALVQEPQVVAVDFHTQTASVSLQEKILVWPLVVLVVEEAMVRMDFQEIHHLLNGTLLRWY